MADTNDDELLRAVKRVRKALLGQRKEAFAAADLASKETTARGERDNNWWLGYAAGFGHAADMLKNAMQEAKR